MRPVKATEILTYSERLGIAEIVEPPGAGRSVRHLLRYTGKEGGQDRPVLRTAWFDRLTMNGVPIVLSLSKDRLRANGCGSGIEGPPLPQTLMIFPRAHADWVCDSGWSGYFAPAHLRNISCVALSTQRLNNFHREFSEKTGTPVFASSYDDSLLYSRLTGLLRERGERQVMVHGVLVRVAGLGVLLLGESGIGKTACGLALMEQDNRWVADDAVVLEGRGSAVYGRGHQRTAGLIAVRGRGVSRAACVVGAKRLLQETRVDLIVRLVRGSARNSVREAELSYEIVGVPLPCREFAADGDSMSMAKHVMDYVCLLQARGRAV